MYRKVTLSPFHNGKVKYCATSGSGDFEENASPFFILRHYLCYLTSKDNSNVSRCKNCKQNLISKPNRFIGRSLQDMIEIFDLKSENLFDMLCLCSCFHMFTYHSILK